MSQREDRVARGSRHLCSPTQVTPIRAHLNPLNNSDTNNYLTNAVLGPKPQEIWLVAWSFVFAAKLWQVSRIHLHPNYFLTKTFIREQWKTCATLWYAPQPTGQVAIDYLIYTYLGKIIIFENLEIIANYWTGLTTLLSLWQGQGWPLCCPAIEG